MCILRRTLSFSSGRDVCLRLLRLPRLARWTCTTTREAFVNKLEGVEFSQTDYAHAQQVWENFHCQSQKVHGALPPERHVPAMSAPQLTWNALLKHIDRPFPLITDPEMYYMIQPNICNGIWYARVRYARAINKLMGSLYDPRQPSSDIMEVNVNNRDEWAMSQKMPDGDFEWLNQDECNEMKLLVNYADGRIAIFYIWLFNHHEN